MMRIRNIKNRFLEFHRAPIFSPKGFLVRAALIAAAFLALRAAGLREYTSILCGSSPTASSANMFPNIFAVAYLLFYFAFVIGVPILLIAAAIQGVLQHLIQRRASGGMTGGD